MRYRLEDGTVKLVVGVTSWFIVHEHLLRSHSDFFDKALNKQWEEGQARVIRMPDDNGDVVYRYIQWLYTKTIACKCGNRPQWRLLADLYVLGEKILDVKFQDCVIDCFLVSSRDSNAREIGYFPKTPATNLVYQGTPEGSPARRLMVDLFINYGNGKWITPEDGNRSRNNHEFVMDLATALLDKRQLPAASREDSGGIDIGRPCHKHKPDEACGSQVY